MQENAPALSIIVPVYKVEKYLPACIDSILAQTFRDFELILVDDGSPDNCPALCDAAAEKDDRIRVIHQKNGGLSAARNAGLDIARGQWIGFVDSDDTIAPDMYEALYHLAQEHHADLAICGFVLVNEDGRLLEALRKEPRTFVYDRREAIARITTGDFHVAWNKLYRRNIFAALRYPVGKLNEDTFVIPAVLEQADTVVYTQWQYYHYCQRGDSIMGRKKQLKNYDVVEAAYGCWECLLRNGETEALPNGARFVLGNVRSVYCNLSPEDRRAPRSREMKKLQWSVAWRTFRAGAFSPDLLLRTLFFQLWPMGYGKAYAMKKVL